MIAPLLLAISALSVQDAPIQKQTLPNGVVLYAEEMPKAQGFSLHFFVSTLGHSENEKTAGQRHLLEHLLAKGQKRDLDARLEVQGVSLSADTLRDGIRFELEGPSEYLALAVNALTELITAPDFTEEEITKEVKVIEQEFAVRSVNSRLSAALWEHAYGAKESDPYGSLENFEIVSASSLSAVYTELFRASSMTVTIVGDIDATTAMLAMTSAFRRISSIELTERIDRAPYEFKSVGFAANTPGSGRAVFVPAFDHALTLPVIAAAYAIAIETDGARVVYTPTPLGGLVSIVHSKKDGLTSVDSLIRSATTRMFVIGKSALKSYIETVDGRSREKARLYGQMLLLKRSFQIDNVKRQASTVTENQFRAALQKFSSTKAISVGGTR